MQESTSITFEPIRHTSALQPWMIVLAIVLLMVDGCVGNAAMKKAIRPK